MDLISLLERVVETQEPSARDRLRAAVRLGARLALEAVTANPNYESAKDAGERLLRVLNLAEGVVAIPATPAPLSPPPSPVNNTSSEDF